MPKIPFIAAEIASAEEKIIYIDSSSFSKSKKLTKKVEQIKKVKIKLNIKNFICYFFDIVLMSSIIIPKQNSFFLII